MPVSPPEAQLEHATESAPDAPDLLPSQPAQPSPFYGPVIAAACTIALVATAPGQTVVVSQFNDSFTTTLGLSATQLSTAYLVGTVTAAMPLTFVGAIADKFGPRRVMFVIALLFGGACIAAGQARSLPVLTLCFFGLRFLGQGSLSMLSGHILALWYERKLGTINGLKMVFAQGGFALTPLIAIGLIQWIGWRWAYAALGVLVWLIVLPLAAFVLRDRPEEKGQQIDGDAAPYEPDESATPEKPKHPDPAFTLKQTVSTRAFWILAGAMVLSGFTGTALLFHAQPILIARGLDPALSAAMSMSWALAVAALVLPVGYLADRVPPRGLLALAALLMAASPGLVIVADSAVLLCAAMALYGMAMAIGSAVGVPTVARYFGRRHHGSIRGFLTFLGVAGTGLGPVVLGVSLDYFGGFAAGLALCAALAVALAFASMTLRRPLGATEVART
ncbi:MAG: MFS transporter [Phycisphaerales bacterium]|jgi:OFA family oxalate/formate antiporter-like MFS transporter